MHLVSRAFRSVVANNDQLFSPEQIDWYEQILRLIALTHDLGHAPFSHGSELVFPEGLEHEDFTDKIITNTEIADYIHEIGANYVKKYGSEYNITPDLICSIYHGKNITNPDFIFLKKFMDSELDCDKMDYLLRDSLYCGVSYGKYDIDRLISCLTAYQKENNTFLAIEKDGLHAFEEFVLARYFMFIQVYFHKTRRILDRMLVEYLKEKLPEGKYPEDVNDYLKWDDGRVWEMLRRDVDENEAANRLVNRRVLKKVYESSTHCGYDELKTLKLLKIELQEKYGEEYFIYDTAEKLTHKIPLKYEIDNEKSIPIILDHAEDPSTINQESGIIKKITEPINIFRI